MMEKQRKKGKMRALSVIVVILVIGAALVGCGGGSQEVSYTLTQNDVKTVVTYYAEGDRVVKQTLKSTIPYSRLGATTSEEAKKVLDPQSQKFQGIEGLQEKIEYQKDTAVETLSVDYDKIDMEKAKGLPGMSLSGSEDAKKISLKKSVEMLEQSGYKKVE
jgi:uncharacterized lipoprotein YehR (DUF1307 family)